MKTAMVFRADGKLQAIFKIDDEEKFKIVLKTLYDFPYFIEIVDELPTLSSMVTTENTSDDTIKISIKDRYNSSEELKVHEEVVTYDYLKTLCTLERFNKIFSK
jgi:Mg2+/Co2+ transporter CorC